MNSLKNIRFYSIVAWQHTLNIWHHIYLTNITLLWNSILLYLVSKEFISIVVFSMSKSTSCVVYNKSYFRNRCNRSLGVNAIHFSVMRIVIVLVWYHFLLWNVTFALISCCQSVKEYSAFSFCMCLGRVVLKRSWDMGLSLRYR